MKLTSSATFSGSPYGGQFDGLPLPGGLCQRYAELLNKIGNEAIDRAERGITTANFAIVFAHSVLARRCAERLGRVVGAILPLRMTVRS